MTNFEKIKQLINSIDVPGDDCYLELLEVLNMGCNHCAYKGFAPSCFKNGFICREGNIKWLNLEEEVNEKVGD